VPGFSLTRIQKNSVLEAIQAAELSAADFKWIRTTSDVTQSGPGRAPFQIDTLLHGPTRYYFSFDIDHRRSSLWAVFNPGRNGARRREHAGAWGFVLGYVREWLARVKQEHEAPDLWAALRQEAELVAGAVDGLVENTPFTEDEQRQIEAHLAEAKEYVRATQQLTPAQYESIDTRLDYLVDAAKRGMGRVDWRKILVGSFVSLVLQMVVPADVLQQSLPFIVRGLAALFRGDPTLELPGGGGQPV
jgi:hypothetical protein